jgi:formate hydrogenlyase transcriptional activator
VLTSLCRLLSPAPDDRPLPESLLVQTTQLAGADHGSLTLPARPDRPAHGFVVEGPGAPAGAIDLLPADLGETTAAAVLPGARVLAARSGDTPLPFPEDRLLSEQGYRHRVFVPLLCRGEGVGVLALAWKGEGVRDLSWLGQAATVLALALAAERARDEVRELRARLDREAGYLREEVKGERGLRLLTGEGPAMRAVRQAIRQVARTDSTVLIAGETGTGKELVARAIHQLSPRRERLLVSVNCAALAPSVIASELFGHEAGAFTGAVRRRVGRFELAHRGTLFLDEVGEVPPEVQVLLLRVLQERVIERVGGNEPVRVDVRVIAATNRDLRGAVGRGEFRDDLYYRLNVFPIAVPPLRQRPEDVPSLVQHFLGQLNRRMNRQVTRIDPASLALLQGYDWPGNVRELENVIERAVIVAPGDTLSIEPSWFPAPPAAEGPSSLAEAERRAIREALRRCDGRIYGPSGAAAALGLKPTTLYGKMRKLGVSRRPAGDDGTTR